MFAGGGGGGYFRQFYCVNLQVLNFPSSGKGGAPYRPESRVQSLKVYVKNIYL